MDEGARVVLNGKPLTLGAGFFKLMDGVAVAVTATDAASAIGMYLRLGEGGRFTELIDLAHRVEAQRLLRHARERALAGLKRWVDRFEAPHYEVVNAFSLLDTVAAGDYGPARAAMDDVATPEDVGWALAVHLASRHDTFRRDVVPRDIVRAVAKAGHAGALEQASAFRSLRVTPPPSQAAA